PLELQREYTVSASHPGYMNAVENFRSGGIEEVRRAATEEADRIVLDHEITLIPITEEERKIYAFTVEFDFDLFDIRPEEERKLDSVAVLLELYPNSTVVISGHTDSVGTDMYNIRLGYNRAKQVSTYVETWLRRKNVRLQNDMEIRTYGETEPIAPNSTEEGRQRNRRVEIALVRNE
ncbi:MAG: OmpA family protein, partial [Bacteroidetes bacterium]|nr:OmpA family protein [Bacteroidota bacterium]